MFSHRRLIAAPCRACHTPHALCCLQLWHMCGDRTGIATVLDAGSPAGAPYVAGQRQRRASPARNRAYWPAPHCCQRRRRTCAGWLTYPGQGVPGDVAGISSGTHAGGGTSAVAASPPVRTVGDLALGGPALASPAVAGPALDSSAPASPQLANEVAPADRTASADATMPADRTASTDATTQSQPPAFNVHCWVRGSVALTDLPVARRCRRVAHTCAEVALPLGAHQVHGGGGGMHGDVALPLALVPQVYAQLPVRAFGLRFELERLGFGLSRCGAYASALLQMRRSVAGKHRA